jgi:hypothetical protein
MKYTDKDRAAGEAIVSRLFTVDDIATTRATAFAGGGVSLALILLLAQIRVDTPYLQLSLSAAAVSMPLWVAAASCDQIWGLMKLTHADRRKNGWINKVLMINQTVAFVSLLIAIASLIYHLSPFSAKLFMWAGIAAVITVTLGLVAGSQALIAKLKSESGQENPTTPK